MLNPRELEPALTEKDMILRDGFVSEYLKDFDPFKACLRLGFQPAYATSWKDRLYNDGYVQRKLAHMMSRPVATPEQDAIDRAMVENTLRIVMQRGSDSARVAAARQFSAMRGWGDDEGAAAEDLASQFRRVAQELPA